MSIRMLNLCRNTNLIVIICFSLWLEVLCSSGTSEIIEYDTKMSTTALFTTSADLHQCHRMCIENRKCVTFSHNVAELSCELLGSPEIGNLVAAGGWTLWNLLYPTGTDICSKNRCDDGEVCVKYSASSAVTLNLNKDNVVPQDTKFICSRGSWILQQYRTGKQNCYFKELEDMDLPNDDMDSSFSDNYMTAFQLCEETEDCKTISCIFRDGNNPSCYIKQTSPLLSGTMIGKTETTAQKYITWYINCE